MQGCPLRCKYCHNPDTWETSQGDEYTSNEIFEKIKAFKPYFGDNGGITISGGEALLQPDFVKEIFHLSKKNNINTTLDTSGVVLNEKVKELLKYCDTCLLDIKALDEKGYKNICGGSYKNVISFLDYLQTQNITTYIRYVVVPTITDSTQDIKKLKKLTKNYNCIKRVDFLPFKKMCVSKYENLNISFPLALVNEATENDIKKIKDLFKSI